VPNDPSGSTGPFNLNNGGPLAMPDDNPFKLDPLVLPPPSPFNVVRSNPIHPSTQSTNRKYQQLLRDVGSVLQFYQLVVTQWPKEAGNPTIPGTPDHTFPGTGDTSAFANTTMETFEQQTTSCMACHNRTRAPTDFLWTLKDRAFAPNIPSILKNDQEIKSLKNVLIKSHDTNRQLHQMQLKKIELLKKVQTR
jgi:hypothetical protein